MSKKYKYLQLILFFWVFTLIGFRMVHVSVFNTERARNGLLGDGFSDKNTLSSAAYFLDSGFTQTRFLPVHDYFPEDTSYHKVVYTHYPALPNILAGFYATLFQTKSETLLRIIPVFLAMFFFFFIYYLLNAWVKDESKAMLGAACLWLANYFICWGDNLHQHLYGELLKWIYVYGLYLYFESNRNRKMIWAGLMLILILEVNISFEQPVFLGMITLGFSWIYRRKIFSFETISAAMMVVLGFGLHMWQNASYLGSWQAALDDMTKAYTFRATGADTMGYIKEKEFTWRNFPEIPFDWFNRMERFYLIPGWSMLILWIWFRKPFKQQYPKLFQIHIALFIASITWTFLMAQHAYVHAFTNKHFSIWFALGAAVCLPLYIDRLKLDMKQTALLPKLFHGLFLFYSLGMMLSQQVWEVWLKFSLLFPRFGN